MNEPVAPEHCFAFFLYFQMIEKACNDKTVGRILALNIAKPGSISSIPFGPPKYKLSVTQSRTKIRSNFGVRACILGGACTGITPGSVWGSCTVLGDHWVGYIQANI